MFITPRHVIALTLATCSALALAQQRPAAQQSASNPESADELIGLAMGTVQRIDAGQAESLWQLAPALVQQRMNAAEYAAGVMRERNKMGAVQRRAWSDLNRLMVNTGPAGNMLCANVVFNTIHNTNQEASERVSLCFTQAGWRPTGYTVQPITASAPQQAAPAAPARRP